MKSSSALLSHSVAIAAAAVLLSSCSAPGGTSNSLSTLQPASQGTRLSLLRALTSTAVVPPKTVHQDHRKSWISRDADGAPRWAVISDGETDDIDIFSLPDFKPIGAFRGAFDEPQGMCTAKSGIWIANTGTEQMLEYSRAGKEIASLSDSAGYPVGCAVDKSGDLAVTDIFGFSGAGQVLLYKNATGTPTELSNSSQYYYYFDGFDTSGNLYVSGKDSSGSYMLSECKAGSTSCTTITISGGTIYFPGMVQWYKPSSYLAVGDQLCGDTEASCIYWVQISGSQGTITGKTTFLNSSGGQVCDMVEGELDPVFEKNLVGGDYEYCGAAPTSVDRWLYPAGGEPTNSSTSVSEPIGVAIIKK
jgi:hypothetical protein